MATTNFTSTLTLTSSTNLRAQTTLTDAMWIDDGQFVQITNTKTSNQKIYPSAINITVAGTKTVNCVAGSPLGNPFDDGVHNSYWELEDGSGNLYTSTAYALITTTIDADIASYPQTSLFNLANLSLMNYFRAQVDVAWAALDYTEVNRLIGVIENLLNATPLTFTQTALLNQQNNIFVNVISNPDVASTLTWQTNYIWNTLTQDVEDAIIVENDYLLSDGVGNTNVTSESTFVTPIYNDGVIVYYSYLSDEDGNVFENNPNAYVLVTTTITAQFATYEANYDPNNTDQADAYADMLTAFATITTLSSDLATNFAAINAQIVIIQDLLELFVDVTATLTLTNKSNLLITLNGTNLPNVVYDTQVLTLSNANDDTQEYILEDAFPLNYLDLTKTLNSDTINFGSQFSDGVYQMNVSWNSANDMTFNAQAYCLVTTQIDCGIAGIIAKRPNCKPLISKLNELMTYRRMITDSFANTDYSTTNFYINKCLNLLNSNGCNCGC